MPASRKGDLHKNPADGKYYTSDPLATGGDYPGFREATNYEIGKYHVGPLNVAPGDALSLTKRWAVTSFANDADSLRDHLATGEPNLIVAKTGGGRPHDLGVSTDGGKSFKLIDPEPVRFLPPKWFPDVKGMGGARAVLRAADYALQSVTDPVEFGKDIMDIGVDATVAAATAAATTGGGLAAPATGAAASYFLEDARQRVGMGLGYNKNVNADPLLFAAIGGAPQLGKTMVGAGRRAAPWLTEMASKFTSAKSDRAITSSKILLKRVADPAKASDPVMDVELWAKATRQAIATKMETDFSEKQIAMAMEQNSKRGVNITEAMDPLSRLTMVDKVVPVTKDTTTSQTVKLTGRVLDESGGVNYKPTAAGGQLNPKTFAKGKDAAIRKESELTRETSTTTDKVVSEYKSFDAAMAGIVDSDMHLKAEDLMNDIYSALRLDGINDFENVPMPYAGKIKDALWKLSKDAKVFNGREVSVPFKKEARDLGGRISSAMRAHLDDEFGRDPGTNKKYGELMDFMSDKMKQKEYWEQAAGIWEWKTVDVIQPDGTVRTVATQDKRILDEMTGTAKMTATIEGLYGKGHHGTVKMLQFLKNDWKLDIQAEMERANLATMIGETGAHGAMGRFPQLATGGGFKLGGMMAGMGIGGGYAAGVASGNPIVGAAVGAAAAATTAVVSSPRTIVGGMKMFGNPVKVFGRGLESVLGNRGVKTVINLSTPAAIKAFEEDGNRP